MVALAISIALHEILAGLFAPPGAPPEPEREIAQRVTITRAMPRATPTPKPTPPPTPPPRPVVLPKIAAPAPVHLAVHHAGASHPTIPVVAKAAPQIEAVPTGAAGEGAGAAEGAGSTGNGTGGSGTGGTEPCGGVTFVDVHGSRFDPSTRGFYVDIRLSVRYPDGHSESALLDYPFYYPSEAANPWSDRNLSNPNVPTLMQRPPEALAAGEPPIVTYVLEHTEPDGFTRLTDCPGPP